jgi:hypothetical protein
MTNSDTKYLLEFAQEANDALFKVMATLMMNNLAIVENKEQLLNFYIDKEILDYPDENRNVFVRAIEEELNDLSDTVKRADVALKNLDKRFEILQTLEQKEPIENLEQLKEIIYINYDALADMYSDQMIDLEVIMEKLYKEGEVTISKEIDLKLKALNRYFEEFGEINLMLDVHFDLDDMDEEEDL